MKNKETRNIMMFFIISVITLASSVFAWFAISNISNIGGIGSNIPDFTNIITFRVKRNNDLDYIKINTIEDMHDVFGRTRPGENYQFVIDFNNNTVKDLTFSLMMNNITTNYNLTYDENKEFDLRDLFKIVDGTVYIYEDIEEELVLKDSYTYPNGKMYINELINENNTFSLFPLINLPAGKSISVRFTLSYDSNVEDVTYINYQYNELSIQGIYVYGQ